MAIIEYKKRDRTFYKVYVQCRSKIGVRIRLQKVLYDLDSLTVAKKEEKRLIKELAEKLAKIEGKGLLWSEIIYRWEVASKNNLLRSKLNTFAILDHANRLRKYTEIWLNRNASDLTRADGRQLFNSNICEKLSLAHLNKIKGSINLVFAWGVEEGLIQANSLSARGPVFGIELGKREEVLKPILTLEEVRKFLLEAKIRKHPWYDIWAFAVSTGMRSGELMALEWGDIDDNQGLIRVSRSYNKRIKDAKCPKNGTWRNVDISPQLRDVISGLRISRGTDKYVLPHFSTWMNGEAALVLRLFLKSIGIEKQIDFHTLRACFATHLLSSGVEQSKVMRMGGWKDLKTFQIYLRLAGIDVKGITENFNVLPDIAVCNNVLFLVSQK